MTLAVLFSGQGMQHAGMLQWLAPDDALLAEARSRLGVADWRASLSDPTWASTNRNAQLLLTACCIAAWQRLQDALPTPVAVAGYSVGEIAAFTVAGVMRPAQALDFADARAKSMNACGACMPGTLLGVSGAPLIRVLAVCQNEGVFVAIHNGPDTFVLGGSESRLQAAHARLADSGAQCTPLCVSVASHTPQMRSASQAMQAWLGSADLARPNKVLVSNLTATRVRSEDQAREALAGQICQPVLWEECMEVIHEQGPSCVLEMGPGQSLARLWNRRFSDVPARSADEFRSASAIVRWVHAHQA